MFNNILKTFLIASFLFLAPQIIFAQNSSMPETKIPEFKLPKLQVLIPGLKFNEAKCEIDPETNGMVCGVPWIADYMEGIFKYSLSIIGILATIIIMYGGVLWLTAGDDSSKIKEAKAWISASITGTALLFCSVIILNIINPALTKKTPIKIGYVAKIPSTDEEELATEILPENIVTYMGKQMTQDTKTKLEKAVATLKVKNINIVVTSGLRTLEKQKDLYRENCCNKGCTCDAITALPVTGTCKCSPATAKPIAGKSPHLSGNALDLWGLDANGKQCLAQATCMKNNTTCKNNPIQKEVIAAMKDAGFCNLSTEAWHFESVKMSSICQ